ncbi:MAG: peptidoglycan-binding protein [Ruminococcus sp.]|nr:peptidoglycan-binding protein [Ruminococcus sp.]MCD7799793.1 peptidoglycan-binding protein [Ruminococcus sp.]
MSYTPAQQRNNIKEFQEYLYAISFYNNNVMRVIPDGIFGRETMLAVKSFQKEYGLDVTGEVNRQTWDTAVKVYRNYVSLPPEAIDIFPSNNFILQKGNKGSLVYILQAMLLDIATTYNNLPMLKVTGVYDQETIATVKAMQNKSRINSTGLTNKMTWNIIVKTFSHLDSSLKY